MDSRENWTYKKIRELHIRETRTRLPTKFTEGLYSDIMQFFRETGDLYQEAREEDPEAQEAVLLGEEYYKVRRIIKELYECRERKITLLALRRAKGEGVDTASLTPDEDALFRSLLGELNTRRGGTFETLFPCRPRRRAEHSLEDIPGQGPGDRPDREGIAGAVHGDLCPEPKGPSGRPPAGPEPGTGIPELGPDPEHDKVHPEEERAGGTDMGTGDDGRPVQIGKGKGGEASIPDAGAIATDTSGESEYILARILTDVGKVIAADMREYNLMKEDIVSLPRDTAAILTARGKAEIIGPEMGIRF